MTPQTSDQVFKGWLSTATMDELDEEALTLAETNASILSQIEAYEFRCKLTPPTQESEEWKLRASHLQRRTYYQMRAIDRKGSKLEAKLQAAVKLENGRTNLELSRLKNERERGKDRVWINVAKEILDAKTIWQITTQANKDIALALDHPPEAT